MRATFRKSGFTLVETMVAVTILSLITVMVYSCWAAVLRASQSSTVAAQEAQRERMAMLAIEQALSGAVWYDTQTEETIVLESIGHFSHLKVISRVPPGFWGNRELGDHPLRRIEFISEVTEEGQAQLIMYQQAVLSDKDIEKPLRTVLLSRLAEFSVDVKLRVPMAEWTTELRSIKTIPAMARVSLGSAAEFPRSKTIPVVAHLVKRTKPHRPIVRLSGNVFQNGGLPVPGARQDDRVIFMIDKSASMKIDNRLKITKSAVKKTLTKMAQSGDSKFTIYTFNKSSDRLPRGLLRASGANVDDAGNWLDRQSAREGKLSYGNQGIIDCLLESFRGGDNPTEVHVVSDSGLLRDVESGKSLGILGALTANNTNETEFHIYLLQRFGEDLDGHMATPEGAELEKIVTENNGVIHLIKLYDQP